MIGKRFRLLPVIFANYNFTLTVQRDRHSAYGWDPSGTRLTPWKYAAFKVQVRTFFACTATYKALWRQVKNCPGQHFSAYKKQKKFLRFAQKVS